MKRSLPLALGAILALAAAAVYFIAWPAWQDRQDDQWQKAGERALARVVVPAAFHPFSQSKSANSSVTCADTQRCFVADGDPRSNVAAVRAAFTSVLHGPLRAACEKEGPSTIPDRCSLRVPVAGSRLVVFLFARPVPGGKPLSHFSGSYVEILIDSRT